MANIAIVRSTSRRHHLDVTHVVSPGGPHTCRGHLTMTTVPQQVYKGLRGRVQDVAVKCMPHRMASRQALARLREEVQVHALAVDPPSQLAAVDTTIVACCDRQPMLFKVSTSRKRDQSIVTKKKLVQCSLGRSRTPLDALHYQYVYCAADAQNFHALA